jgi:hypothetical protein
LWFESQKSTLVSSASQWVPLTDLKKGTHFDMKVDAGDNFQYLSLLFSIPLILHLELKFFLNRSQPMVASSCFAHWTPTRFGGAANWCRRHRHRHHPVMLFLLLR